MQKDKDEGQVVIPYVLTRSGYDPAGGLSIDYSQELNAQQLAAVTAEDGPALVIAGAGSGKTRTLVYRVAYLIDRGVDPGRILLLTFTRKAAQEMVKRAGLIIGSGSDRVAGGTFHSLANMILRRHGRAVGLTPNFSIMDRGDAEDLINLFRAQLGFNEKEKRFPRKGTILEMFSKSANTLRSLDDIILEEFPQFAEHLTSLQRLFSAYENAKQQRQVVDYDDLLVKLQAVLASDPTMCRHISQAYQYILVDEYQDTNRLQAGLVRQLAQTHDNVMVVGDDSQSIYGFRGATFRNIMDFPSFFPGTTVYTLEENYRSTQPILALANAIMNGASEKYSKTLFTRRQDGALPVLVHGDGEHAQSRFIAQKILELREEGIPLSDMAVLFRSSFHSFDLEVELSRRGVPFEKRGGFKFIETAHVKDLVAHLRVLDNPLDGVSWNRLLLLVDGVGAKKAQDLIQQLLKANDPLRVLRGTVGRVASPLQELAFALEEADHDHRGSPAEGLRRLFEYYLPILKQRHDDYPKRIRDLEHLASMAERYSHLDQFLADIALEPPDQAVAGVGAVEPEKERSFRKI